MIERLQDVDDATLDAAIREAGCDPDFRDDVRALVQRPENEWPICCNSDCSPCVLPMIRAATLVKQRTPRPAP
jgi:hypothetical protein